MKALIQRSNSLLVLMLVVLLACKTTKTSQSTTTTTTTTTTTATATATTVDAAGSPVVSAGLSAQAIPFDPQTRTGVLDNGLKYYIRKNAKPENFAELRLALNAGSIQENDQQLGLAHFVEHMCFNGTLNFPKSELVDYLESIGTKFGAHLNAYTSFDETVYMLRVPTDNEEQFSRGFQILEDWAHNVSFEGEEIDKERGVVIEEWRTRLGASWRMLMQTYPKEFYQSRYIDRLPIGSTDILANFEHETLRKFYRDWYRPDLMAVVAVGDFDVDEVEAMIKEKFGRIPQSESAPERVSYPVPDHAETLIAIASDEEASSNRVEIMYKHDPQPMKTLADYRRNVIQRLASNLINARLDELGQQATPPFTYAYSGYSNMARTKDAYSSVAIVGEEQFLSGLKSLLIENERAQRFGFTQSELDRIKNATLSRLQAALKEADKTESSRLVMSYVYHFLEDSPVPGIEQTVALYEQLLPGINLEEINAAFEAFLTEENRVLVVSGVKKEGVALPTETEVRALLQEVSQQALTAYEDNVSAEPLMAELPTSGSISSEKEEAGIGVTELTLSNGVRVILKPTDFKNDEISLTAYSPGGSSLYDDETYWSASFADAIVSESGLAGFDNVQLTKYLSDKVVSASPYISELEEGIQAASSPADLETCLQLVHLYFTQPRKDEQAFASLMAKNKSYYANILSNPEYWFRGEVLEILYGNHPRRKLIAPPEELDKIKLDKAYEVYQDRFSDASDFTFLLVGAFEVEAIKPLLAQYLGSLPNQAREENWKDVGATPAEGPLEKSFYRGKEPKSQVQLMINDTFEWNAKTRYDLNSAMQVLGIMLRESMREDMGGVYGVRSGVNASRYPQNRYSISISFTCAPENVKGLIEAARRDMENLQENGPSEKNLQKIKETQRKEQQLNLQDNRFWLRSLEFAYQNELDPNRILDAEKRIDALTAEDVQQAAQKYMDLGKLTQFVLYPESEDVQP